MLLWLTQYLSHYYSGFHVFEYLTLRAILGVLTALLIAFCLGPAIIARLTKSKWEQMVREYGPESHLKKQGTPTMGGMLIMLALITSTVLWADMSNFYILVMLVITVLFSIIGWADDYLKISQKNSKGLKARHKYFLQSLFGFSLALVLFWHAQTPAETTLIVPFIKQISLNLGWFYVFWVYLVVVGSSNAVNLTDGLDGLAILPVVLVGGALGIFAYVAGHSEFAHYLGIPYIAGVGECVVYCGALVGAGLGFLWFNTYPAQVFMGDMGALALGAALGTLSVIVRQELVLLIMGGVFVMETISVILQVGSFRLTGKRIFKMAPLHHHYELKGWAEPKVIVRFWIVTVILVMIGLASLKIR